MEVEVEETLEDESVFEEIDNFSHFYPNPFTNQPHFDVGGPCSNFDNGPHPESVLEKADEAIEVSSYNDEGYTYLYFHTCMFFNLLSYPSPNMSLIFSSCSVRSDNEELLSLGQKLATQRELLTSGTNPSKSKKPAPSTQATEPATAETPKRTKSKSPTKAAPKDLDLGKINADEGPSTRPHKSRRESHKTKEVFVPSWDNGVVHADDSIKDSKTAVGLWYESLLPKDWRWPPTTTSKPSMTTSPRV